MAFKVDTESANALAQGQALASSQPLSVPGVHMSKPATPQLKPARSKTVSFFTALTIGLLASLIAACMLGPVQVTPTEILQIFAAHLAPNFSIDQPPAPVSQNDTIIWAIRVPRALLGAAVGAGLAITGAVLQSMVRNMLADPYIIGVNSGASCGAALAIIFGTSITTLLSAGTSDYLLQGFAFLGAVLASALVFAIARVGGRLTSVRLLMAGVAVGYALSACTSFLIFAADSAQSSRSVMFWLLGSLGLATWGGPLAITILIVFLSTVFFTLLGPRLDALASGDETALTLGIDPEKFRALLLLVVCLVVGVVVAMAGSIGFVGLVVPHLARRIVGTKHRLVLPVSALLGATLLVWADILARTLLSPQEVPIGIITALLGAPFLLFLVRRMNPAK